MIWTRGSSLKLNLKHKLPKATDGFTWDKGYQPDINTSYYSITSGRVLVIDLRTAVKELVLNSGIDAGARATNIGKHTSFIGTGISNHGYLEVRFKHYGLKSVEIVDNGSGISESDYENIGLLRSLGPPRCL